jgi:alpha-beta hydrolase superfamily lysophospholipase
MIPMKSVLARWVCSSVFAVVLPTLALAQSPAQTQPPKNSGDVSKAAVDPATVQNLVSARDYRPPEGIAFNAADFFSDNVRLTAQWFYAAENERRKLPTIIIAHGWGGKAANLRQDAIDFARAGYLVMLFDYRGWGDSNGRVMLMNKQTVAGGGTFTTEVRELRGYIDPREQVNDWFNAIHYAVTYPMVDAGRIGVLGSDLSGGHVIYVAAHEPRVKALVSEVSSVDLRPYKPYQSEPVNVIAQANASASRLATGQEQYPSEYVRVGSRVGAPVGANLVRWAPVEHANRVSAPALFVLAENEELFSNTNNGQLACERVTGPRKLVMLPNITHYGIYDAERKRTITLAIDWFDKYLKSASSQTGAPNLSPTKGKEPERGECSPPPEPPKGETDEDGSGEGHRAPDASTRWN